MEREFVVTRPDVSDEDLEFLEDALLGLKPQDKERECFLMAFDFFNGYLEEYPTVH